MFASAPGGSVAFSAQHEFAELARCIIGIMKLTVVRHTLCFRIVQIAHNDAPDALYFLCAGLLLA